MTHVRVAWEPFEAIWPEIREMTEENARETEPEGLRPFKLDAERVALGSKMGFLRIYVARVEGEIWGYCMWSVQWDLWAQGALVASQAAWFVRPRAPWGLGAKLFMESLEHLKSLGVQTALLSERTQGRGRGLGRFFERLGARFTGRTYLLSLKDH